MKRTALKIDFMNFPDTTLIPFVQGALSSMTGNAHFTDPAPRLADVQTAYDAYVDSVPSRNARNGINSAEKNEKKDALLALLRQLVRYVEATAQDDLEALESSGFNLQKAKQTVGPMPQGNIKSVKPGPEEGSLDLRATRVPGAKFYEVQVSRDGNDWQHHATSSTSKMLLTGLSMEAKTWIRLRLHGAAGPGPWSNPVQARAR